MAAQHDPPLFDAVERLQVSVPCIGCRYDLRGLRADANCTECNLPIAESLAGATLRLMHPSHVAVANDALRLLQIGWLLAASLACACSAIFDVAGTAGGLVIVVLLAQLCALWTVAGALGMLSVANPLDGARFRRLQSRGLSAAVVLGVAVPLGVFGLSRAQYHGAAGSRLADVLAAVAIADMCLLPVIFERAWSIISALVSELLLRSDTERARRLVRHTSALNWSMRIWLFAATLTITPLVLGLFTDAPFTRAAFTVLQLALSLTAILLWILVGGWLWRLRSFLNETVRTN